ncbi:MAG: UDP-N-acetylmuramate dehydrogenase [Candidatus Eisenbacteria bacterium]|nr:UDP-N-acetylmuramate dehydrogenase [Candidatus Eisenbacteria bacterium]
MILVVEMQKKEVERRISDAVEGRCEREAPLKPYTTFRIGGPADLLVHARTEEEIRGVLRILDGTDVPLTVLGGGSNILVRDGGVRGVVLRPEGLGAIAERDGGIVEAGAGVSFGALLRFTRERGLTGLEFLAGIPGAVGGGIATNAGAFGTSLGERTVEARVLDRRAVTRSIPREELRFGYRRSELPGGAVVVAATFHLEKDDPKAVEERIRANREVRARTQPLDRPSAGCVFRNPSPDRSAGKLIDEAGCKGMRVGGAVVSPVHANWIVNDGGATARDVLALLDEVRRIVRERSGVLLEPEIRVVGEA